MKDAGYVVRRLARKGFDIGQALEICADDMDLYMEVLETALEEGTKKYEIIRGSLDARDYERYHVEVHALKNAARAIGAMELSSLSLEQEQAAKRKDFERVESGGPELLKVYGQVLKFLKQLLESGGGEEKD